MNFVHLGYIYISKSRKVDSKSGVLSLPCNQVSFHLTKHDFEIILHAYYKLWILFSPALVPSCVSAKHISRFHIGTISDCADERLSIGTGSECLAWCVELLECMMMLLAKSQKFSNHWSMQALSRLEDVFREIWISGSCQMTIWSESREIYRPSAQDCTWS